MRMAWACLLVVFAAYVAVALGVGGPGVLDFFSSWVCIGLVLGAAALLALRGFASDDRRAPWLALSLGAAMWAVGEIIYELAYSEAPELAPYPSIADAFWLGSYFAVGTGIVLVLRSRLRRAFHATMWLDAAIGAATVSALAATIAFDPVLTDTAGYGWETATDLAYPLLDLGLLSLVATLLALTGWRPGLGWALFAVALSMQAISDVLYAREIALGTDSGDTLLAPLWPAAMLLLAYAAWRPLSDEPAPRRAARARVHLPGRVHADRARDPRLRPDPLGQHARRRARRDRDRAGRRPDGAVLPRQPADAAARPPRRADRRAHRACPTAARSWRRSSTRSRARSSRGSLALFDLDGFKRYNDAYGHPAGDALLTRLSGALGDVVDGHGRAFRLGGDEFCLLLDDGTSDSLLVDAARALEARGDGFDVTASYGVVRLPADADTPEEALHLADRRMYAAKEARPSSAGLQTRTVLLKVLSEREPDLHEHSSDVMALARGVARRLGLPVEERDIVARAAELHDIGKMAIPDAILNKPGPLDDREWRFMRRHTIIGEDILNVAPALQPVAALVRASHERWDGKGYPDGTSGDEIPRGARIVAVCDAFSAMVQDRPYQAGLSVNEAVSEIERCAGTNFDPAVVEAFAAEIRSEAVTV